MRRHIAWFAVLLVVLKCAAQSSANPLSAAQAQQIVDILAKPIAPGPKAVPYPLSYQAWTDEQRTLRTRQVETQCIMLWGMINDRPIRLLPQAQPAVDASRLALQVCSTARMPSDWPGRRASLIDIKRIMQRSTELGHPMTLPASLAK